MSHFMIDLWHRWQRDVRADRPKAVLLAALFLFGCCFWVPMLAKAVTPNRASAATSQAAIYASAPSNKPERQESSSTSSDPFWATLATSLANDPLFQAAEVNGLERDPFLMTDVSEPLPVLFVEDSSPKVEMKVATVPQESRPLHLTSTMISRSRRAAMINGQFVPVGREIQTNGQSYLLTLVESHRVVLTKGDETIELKMARSRLKDVLDPRSSDDPRE